MSETVYNIIPTEYDGDDWEHCYECDEELDGPGVMVIRDNGRTAGLTHHCSEEHAREYIEDQEPVERITDANGDELERGADTDAQQQDETPDLLAALQQSLDAAKHPSPACDDDKCAGMPPCLSCVDTDAQTAQQQDRSDR